MEKIKRYWNKPSRSAYLFIAPSIVLLILFSIIPLIMAFGLSFFDVPITMNHARFIGWDNFVEAFHDPRFIKEYVLTCSVFPPSNLFCNCNWHYVENDSSFKYWIYNSCITVHGIRKN